MTILRAVGLPDKDGSVVPDVFGLAKRSDPYVKVEAGRASASTRTKHNNLRATWNERLGLGYLRSGTKLRFRVKDRDVGIERVDGKNDALGGADMRVPYCTAFSADLSNKMQDDGLPAATTESPWAMASNRLLCRERGWLRLGDNGQSRTYSAPESRQACCVGRSSPCLEIIVEIEPFQLYVDRKFGIQYQGDEYLSFVVLSGDHNVSSIEREDYESLFLDGLKARPAATTSAALRGALAFRTYRADFEILEPGSLYARLATNYRAKLSLCANTTGETRNCFANLGFERSPYNLPLDNGDIFTCWSKSIGHATRNRYGYVTGGDATALYMPWICPEFFGILEPLPSSQAHKREFRSHVRLDRYVLAARVFQFTIAFIASGVPALRLTLACDFCFERIGAAAVGVLDPTLFDSCGGLSFAARSLLARQDTARRYYWLTRITQAVCTIPCMLFVSFGFSTAVSVHPKLLGWAWILVGGAAVVAAYAGRVWKAARWRLTPAPVASLALTATLVLTFSLVAVNEAPGGNVDFTALTCACLTATLAALALETVERNECLQEARRSVQVAIHQVQQDSTETRVLGDTYTVCSEACAFDFVGDIAGDLCGFANRASSHRAATHCSLVMHILRIIILAIYIAYASAKTRLGVLALVNGLAISFTDATHPLLARSRLFWSPTKVVGLASLGRLALAACGPRYWIVGHSMLFVVYGLPLSAEIVARQFLRLSRLEAAAVVFLQRGSNCHSGGDLAGRPEFILAANASSLLLFVLGAYFFEARALPITPLGRLPGYVFPVCAAFTVTASAFASAGLQAARGKARTYCFNPRCSTPYAYALLVTWLLVCIGLFLWGATGMPAAAVAVLSGFACLASSSYAFQTWMDNDCRALVFWPPRNHDAPARADDAPPVDNQDLALGAIKSMMFNDENQNTQGKQTDDSEISEQPTTFENFKLPPLERIDCNDVHKIAAIDMPVIPQLATSVNQKHNKLKIANVFPLLPLEALQKSLSTNGSTSPAALSSPLQFSKILCEEDQKRTAIIDLGLVELRRLKRRQKSERHHDSKTAEVDDCAVSLTTLEIATQVARFIAARMQFRNKRRPSVAKVQAFEESRTLHGEQSELTPTIVSIAVEEMPFWEAWLSGGLVTKEKLAVYAAVVSPLSLVIFGSALSWASRPKVAGHLVWMSAFALAGLVLPIVKYLRARHDMMKDSVGFRWIAVGAILWWSTLALAFFRLGNSRDDGLAAIVLLDLLLLSPVMYIASALSAIWLFHDDAVAGDVQGALARRLILRLARCGHRCKSTPDNVDEEFASLFRSRKGRWRAAVLATVMLVLSSTQVWLWGSLQTAIIWIVICVGGFEWVHLALPTDGDIVFTARLEAIDRRSKLLVALSLVFFFTGTPRYTATAATLCFLPIIFRFATRLVFEDRRLIVNRTLWTPRACLPVFSYASGDRTVRDTTRPAARLAAVLLVLLALGAALTALALPTSIGVGIVCAAATAAMWLAVTASTRVSLALGEAADYLSPSVFRDAARCARLHFEEEMRVKLCVPLRLGSINPIDGSALHQSFAKEQGHESPKQQLAKSDVESALTLASWLERNSQFEGYDDYDATLEMLRGEGPLGYFGILSPKHYLRRGRQAIDNSAAALSLSRKRDKLVELCEAERRFEERFESEIKCCANFQLLVMCATEEQLACEQQLFRTFVAESKFRLAANGIYPPISLLRDNSDDLQMLAFWLLEILDDEKRRRFHYLQSKFQRHSEQNDAATKEVDEVETTRADEAASCRKSLEEAYVLRQATAVEKSKQARLEAWLSSADVLVKMDSSTAAIAGHLLLSNDEASALTALRYVGSSEDFFEAYKREVSTSCAAVATCLENVAEIEADERDCFCTKGTSGAVLRFLDPDFLANAKSVGQCRGSAAVGERWASKFGTPLVDLKAPQFVCEGVAVADAWLVDAIGVLAAHDKRLLTSTLLLNDKTRVGVHAVKLFVDGTWATIIVDENFPMLGSKTIDEESAVLALARLRKVPDGKTSLFEASPVRCGRRGEDERRMKAREVAACHEARGLAVAHVPHVTELWVSVVEKAAAKLYGSYAALEYGSLHHGLTMLTGCACDRIYLNQAKRGVVRLELWGRLVAAKRRGYALAATSVSPAFASPYARELGLALGATYAIVDLRDVGPQRKLLQLQATRVEHTFRANARRQHMPVNIRHKLEHSDATSCWFDFDDACCALHALYVCQRHSGKRWRSWTKSATWRKKSVVDFADGRRVNLEDTSPGLPSRSNLSCAVERNPQFSIRIFKPTNLHIRLDQVDAAGRRANTLLPVAAFLCRPNELHRVDNLDCSTVLARTGDPNPSPSLYLDVDNLEPGSYVVLCGTYHPGVSGPFTLTVTGDQNVQFDQLWPPLWRPAIADKK